MLKPQGFTGDDDGQTSCALRAAIDAVAANGNCDDGETLNYTALRERWPMLDECVSHPAIDAAGLGFKGIYLMATIYYLNDRVRWTREQIADWVQTIEDARSASSSVDHVELPQPVDA